MIAAVDDAEAQLARAADRGYAPASALLACWRWERTRDPALEEALRLSQGGYVFEKAPEIEVRS